MLPKLTSVAICPLAPLFPPESVFESEFTMTWRDEPAPPVELTGRLLMQSGKFRLEVVKINGKSVGTRDFGVVWDSKAKNGFVFSDALQGYAPVLQAVACTNLFTQTMAGENEPIDGHPVSKANVTEMASDGQTMTVQSFRARDLGDLPLKVDSLTGGPVSFVLALSKIHAARLVEELFLPPDGFTKYESETAMLNELADRQQDMSDQRHERAGEAGGGDEGQPEARPRSRGSE